MRGPHQPCVIVVFARFLPSEVRRSYQLVVSDEDAAMLSLCAALDDRSCRS